MSKLLFLVLCVGAASAEYGWKVGTQYRYEIRGRTVTGLHQVANQFSGILLNGRLTIQPKTPNTLSVKINELKYADIHTKVSSGWSTFFHDDQLNWESIPVDGTRFELKFNNGVISKMYVEKDLPTWQVNILKAIASQLQVDTQGQNLKKSKSNQLPQGQPMGVYKTMEDTVTGVCETMYEISQVQDHLLQGRRQFAPLPHLKGKGHLIEIVKTKNYSECQNAVAYHFGVTGKTNWDPASNQMGQFLSRSTISRIILSGQLNNYTLQSSVTTNKVVVAPHLHNQQKGIVVSRLNLTLEDVSSASVEPKQLSDPRTLNSLVYEYNPASDKDNNLDTRSQKQTENSSSSSDSSDSSSESQENKKHNKQPRSRSTRSVSQTTSSLRQTERDESQSSGSFVSSSEEHLQPRPRMEEAPNSPLLPYFIGNKGNSIQSSRQIDGVKEAIKIAQEISEEIQTPEVITAENTLTKFSILSRLLRTMSYEQIHEVSKQLYFQHSQSSLNMQDAVKARRWAVFRDATVEAGTGPALLMIKEWIKSNKVTGEEAAQMMSALPRTARYPTKEYMDTFFDIMSDEHVRRQSFLNATTVYSFTELVRKSMVYIDARENQYPIYSFGRLPPQHAKVVGDKYVPYLAQQLERAVSEEDSPAITLYIRALGNTAHLKVLAVFKPYLEGKKPLTHFQRVTMVAAMDQMTQVYPNQIRGVLYRLYANSAEFPQVRVAAVMQIMKTNPPAQMLQRMAEYTNYESSKHVNSAVKSAILSASRLTSGQSRELATNAKSAVPFLTKETFGFQYCQNFMRTYIVNEQDLAYKYDAAFFQSTDSFVPSSLFYNIKRRVGGLKRETWQFGYMLSSAENLMTLLFNQFDIPKESTKKEGVMPDPKSDWTYENVSQFLNLEQNEAPQVEGNLLLPIFGEKRYFTFDNHTIERLPYLAKIISVGLGLGRAFNYTKMYNQYSLKVGFPTATGLPFVYSFNTPTLVSVGGQIQAKVKTYPRGESKHQKVAFPKTITANAEVDFVYSTKTQSKMGFICPFNHRRYVAGLDSNVHVYAPLKVSTEIDFEKNNFQLQLEPTQMKKLKVYEESTLPYTTVHNLFDLSPAIDDKNAQLIHVRPSQQKHFTVGDRSTGLAFDLDGVSEQSYIDWATLYNGLRRHDPLSAFLYTDYEKNINQNNYTITFNPDKSSTQWVKLAFSYDVKRNDDKQKSNKVVQGKAANFVREPNLEKRLNDFMEKAGLNIQNSYVRTIETRVEFGGQKRAEYVATAAYVMSAVSPKSRYILYLRETPVETTPSEKEQQQIGLVVDVEAPKVPILNYHEALSADPTTNVDVLLTFGEKSEEGRITMKGKLSQSENRKDFIHQHPMARVCEKQMQNGNLALPACREVTARANMLDNYKFDITYEQVPESWKDGTYKAYTLARYLRNLHVSEDVIVEQVPSGRANFQVDFSRDLGSVNVTFKTPAISGRFENVPVNRWIRPIVVSHPDYDVAQRWQQTVFNSQGQASCVIDDNMATTFDNSSYPIKLGKCWHSLLHYTPKQLSGYEDESREEGSTDYQKITLLVRETAKKNKEVKLVMDEHTIDLLPKDSSGGTVLVNGEEAAFDSDVMKRYYDKEGRVVLMMYQLPAGSIRLFATQSGLELVYDGARVKVLSSKNYRGKVRGLCGTFDGETATDMTTPQECVLKEPFQFASTYAIVDQECQGGAKEMKAKALKAPCHRERHFHTKDAVPDTKAGSKRPEEMKRNHIVG